MKCRCGIAAIARIVVFACFAMLAVSAADCPGTSVQAANAPPPAQTIDPTANAPYPVVAATPAITMQPLLLDMSTNSVEIVWTTDAPTDARVRYGEKALDRVAVPERDGMIPVDTVHRVILRDLQPGRTYRYQVVSRRVVEVRPYWPVMGQSATSAVRSFTTFDAAKASASFAFITDTHEDVDRIDALMRMIRAKPVDFVVDGGDLVNYAVDGDQLRHKFLGPVAVALDGTRTLIYARGNHENRGPYARALGKFLHAQNGRYYYARDDGPLHMLVLDTGEDKPDATNVYSGLNDMRDYRDAERAWFARALQEPRVRSAPFTVLLAHEPAFGLAWSPQRRAAWTRLANQAHVDLFIAGHVHSFELIKPGTQGNDFPILVVGQDQVAHVTVTGMALKVAVTDRHGRQIDAFTLRRQVK